MEKFSIDNRILESLNGRDLLSFINSVLGNLTVGKAKNYNVTQLATNTSMGDSMVTVEVKFWAMYEEAKKGQWYVYKIYRAKNWSCSNIGIKKVQG